VYPEQQGEYVKLVATDIRKECKSVDKRVGPQK